MTATYAPPIHWSPPPLIRDPKLRWTVYVGALTYLVLVLSTVEVNWVRVYEGLERGRIFVAAFLTPDFTSRADDDL